MSNWEDEHWGTYNKNKQKREDVIAIAENSLQKTKELVRTVEQTKQIGAETMVVLSEQTEQLKRIDGHVDDVNANLTVADRTLRGMESIWGSVKNYFSKPGSTKEPQKPSPKLQPTPRQGPQPSPGGMPREAPKGARPSARADSSRPQDRRDRTGGLNEHEEFEHRLRSIEYQQDGQLDDLLGAVSGLKVMSSEMGQEIGRQSVMVSELTGKIERTDVRMRAQEQRVKKLT